jgi:hypothetical protein
MKTAKLIILAEITHVHATEGRGIEGNWCTLKSGRTVSLYHEEAIRLIDLLKQRYDSKDETSKTDSQSGPSHPLRSETFVEFLGE